MTPSRSSRSTRAVTPVPVQRLEGFRMPDWERQGRSGGSRASLAPILRFADVEAFVQAAPDGGKTAPSSRRSSRWASPRRTSRTTSR